MHQQGKLTLANQIHIQVLAKQPDHYDPLNLAGVIALQSNELILALELIGKATVIKPDYAEA